MYSLDVATSSGGSNQKLSGDGSSIASIAADVVLCGFSPAGRELVDDDPHAESARTLHRIKMTLRGSQEVLEPNCQPRREVLQALEREEYARDVGLA